MSGFMKAFPRLFFYDISINFFQVHILANIKSCVVVIEKRQKLERTNIHVTRQTYIFFQFEKIHEII